LGFAAGNIGSFHKSAMNRTVEVVRKRQARYLGADDAIMEARFGGFTDEERAAMQETKAPEARKQS
jgi:hypothetical protein